MINSSLIELVALLTGLLAVNSSSLFTNCYNAGRVDFIYGSAAAVFDHCEIHSRNGGHITAASTPQKQSYGFVFLDCQLNAKQAKVYTVAHIVHGDDGWDPTQAVQIPEANRTAPSTNATPAELNRTLPILFIVGDSTVHNSAPGLLGWGDVLGRFFDTNKIIVENHAKPGRSSRTFQTQGWWAQILAAGRPGDFVLIQMGDNDSSPVVDKRRCRGSIPGIGNESREIYNPVQHRTELVHTYGWYMRKYVSDARAKGMTLIICSPVPQRPKHTVKAGDVVHTGYVKWSAEVARQEHVLFIPLHHLVLMHYIGMTPQELKAKYFTTQDNTHASPAGAALNAASVIQGLRNFKNCPLNAFLLDTTDLPALPASG